MLLGPEKHLLSLRLSGRWYRSWLSATPRGRLPPIAGRSMLRCPVTPPQRGTAIAPATAVGHSLDYVQLRRFLAVVAGASQAAMPSHALAALTALLPVRRRRYVACFCEQTWLRGRPCEQTWLRELPC